MQGGGPSDFLKDAALSFTSKIVHDTKYTAGILSQAFRYMSSCVNCLQTAKTRIKGTAFGGSYRLTLFGHISFYGALPDPLPGCPTSFLSDGILT